MVIQALGAVNKYMYEHGAENSGPLVRYKFFYLWDKCEFAFTA